MNRRDILKALSALPVASALRDACAGVTVYRLLPFNRNESPYITNTA